MDPVEILSCFVQFLEDDHATIIVDSSFICILLEINSSVELLCIVFDISPRAGSGDQRTGLILLPGQISR